MRIGWLGIVMIGCGAGSSEPTDDGGGGACGAVTEHPMELVVTVQDGEGAPVTGAEVSLEERSWEPGILGTGTTDGGGVATLSDLSITGVEDCWGVVLDYQLVVSSGSDTTETSLNSSLFSAVSAGETRLERTVTVP